MNKIFALMAASILLIACSKNQKRVIVYTKGKTSVNEAEKLISIKDGGSGNDEKIIDYNSAEKVVLTLNGLEKPSTVDIAENGLYVLNAKADTIIGSFQLYGAPKENSTVITQEMLKKQIDSLQQLTVGKNITAANRNFFVLPYSAVKISNNIDAFVVGPYHQMTSIAKEEGKEPEVYRFYSIKEVREIIEKLTKLTIAEKK
jgi:hypothetical protein